MPLTAEEQAELQMLQQQLPQLQRQYEQAMAAQQQPSPPQPSVQTPEPEVDRWGDFKRGMGLSPTQTYMGGKAATVGLSDLNKDVLREWQSDVDAGSGWGLAGQTVGDIMQLALPVSWAAKGAKAIGGAAKTALGAEAALGAGYGAAQAMADEDKTAAQGATEGAVGTILGAGLGKVLGMAGNKIVEGVKQSGAAERMKELGVRLTPAMAAEGPLARMFEFTGAYTPVLSRSVKEQRGDAVNQFNRAVMQEAAPSGARITEGGERGFEQLRRAYDDAYDAAWEKARPLELNDIGQLMQNTSITLEPMGREGARVSNRIFDALERVYNTPLDKRPQELRRFDQLLREEGDRAYSAKDWGLHDAIGVIRDDLGERMGEESANALKVLNRKYMDFKAVREAVTSPAALQRGDFGNRGFFSPQELMGAIRSIEGSKASARNTLAEGRGALQDVASAAMDTVGQKIPVEIISGSRGMIEQTPLFGSQNVLRGLADFAMGNTAPQRGAQALRRTLGEARSNATPEVQAVLDAGQSVFSPAVLGASLNTNTQFDRNIPLIPEY